MTDKYIPSEEALKFINFIKACGLEDNTSPVIHYKLADAMFSPEPKDKKVLIECTRGVGKSTLMEYLTLYTAVMGYMPGFGVVNFIVFLGDSQEGNVKGYFRNLATKIEQSTFLQQFITVQRKTDKEMELVNTNGHELDIAGKGMNTNIRGIRYKGQRIDVLICDDVTTNESMTSDIIQETINVNYFNSALPALHPTKHKVFYICTPISNKDLAMKLKESGSYRVERYPLCDRFPCKEEDYNSIWPDRFPYTFADEMFRQFKTAGRTQAFYQEYMLQITDLATLLVDKEDIRWFDPTIARKNKHAFTFYITTDFATSTKKSADFSTIGVWAINSNSDWMLVDGQCKRQTMQENMEDLFKYVQIWKPMSVGIETTGQQGGFISILEEMMMKYKTWFAFAKKRGSKEPGIRPTKDKVHRFVTGVEPKFKQGKIWLPKPDLIEKSNHKLWELVDELLEELGKLTLSGGVKVLRHDDCVDLLNQLSEIDVVPPSDELLEENNLTKASPSIWGDPWEDDKVEPNSMIF